MSLDIGHVLILGGIIKCDVLYFEVRIKDLKLITHKQNFNYETLILYRLITDLIPLMIVAALRSFRFSTVVNLIRFPRVTKKGVLFTNKMSPVRSSLLLCYMMIGGMEM